jgi:hypothetical protein
MIPEEMEYIVNARKTLEERPVTKTSLSSKDVVEIINQLN